MDAKLRVTTGCGISHKSSKYTELVKCKKYNKDFTQSNQMPFSIHSIWQAIRLPVLLKLRKFSTLYVS